MTKIIEAVQLRKIYQLASGTLEVLRGINLKVDRGEFILIRGRSGEGKTTLLKILGCMEQPTSGSLHILGVDTTSLDPDALAQLRAQHFGFIFQAFNLIPALTVAENIELPLAIRRIPRAQRLATVQDMLRRLRMEHLARRLPEELSTGQEQRVAAMRAIAANPPIIIADEPTANLDQENTQTLLHLLRETSDTKQTTIILCSQKEQAKNYADRVYRMEGGQLKPESS